MRKHPDNVDTLADPNVPNYIKAGFKTRLDFLSWLMEQPREKYTQWGYPNHGMIGSDYSAEIEKAAGLPPREKVTGSGSFVVLFGRHIED